MKTRVIIAILILTNMVSLLAVYSRTIEIKEQRELVKLLEREAIAQNEIAVEQTKIANEEHLMVIEKEAEIDKLKEQIADFQIRCK